MPSSLYRATTIDLRSPSEKTEGDFSAAVLLVDDQEERLFVFESVLMGLSAKVIKARSGTEALRLLDKREFAVVLLEINMADMTGLQTAEAIRAKPRLRDLPLIFISQLEPSDEHISHAYALGAVDYIPGPAAPEALRAKVGFFVRLFDRESELKAKDSQRKRDLQTLAARFDRAQQIARVATWEWNGSTKELTCTDELKRLFGFPAEIPALAPEDLFQRVHPDDRAALRSAGLHTLATGTTSVFQFRVIPPDGQTRWLETRVSLVGEAEVERLQLVGATMDVTESRQNARERERILADLQDAHTRLQTVIDHLPAGVAIAEAPSGKLVLHNAVALRLIGHPMIEAEDVGGYLRYGAIQADGSSYRPEDYPIAKAVRNGESVTEEMDYRRPDGSTAHFLVSAAPIRNASGETVAAVSTFHDISEARRRNAQLQEQEEKFRAIFETANEGIWMLDADARITMANERMAELLGYRPEELVGRFKWDFLFPYDLAQTKILFDERRRGLSGFADVRFQHKAGAEIWTHMSARPLYEAGKFVGALDMFSDITERRRAEDALRNSEERYRQFFELSGAGNMQLSLAGVVQRANRRFVALIGYTEQELKTMSVRDLSQPGERERDWRDFEALVAGDLAEVSTEKQLVRKDGTAIWVHFTARAVRDAAGKALHTICVVQDITGLKLAEQELLTLNKDLEARVDTRTVELQDKTLQLERFCYTIAHDLRAPLRSIQAFSHLVREDYGGKIDEPGRSRLDLIGRSAQRMDQLIQDLLKYSRVTLDKLPIRTVDPALIVKFVLREMEPAVKASGSVIVTDLTEFRVRASEHMLAQVLSCLIINAFTFVTGQTIPSILIRTVDAGESVRIDVIDNGIGIASEFHQKIFGVFERLNPGSIGTGIGLAIVKRGVEQMGGRVGVESEPGKGSRFWIELPKAS